jgi:hypothetical protein
MTRDDIIRMALESTPCVKTDCNGYRLIADGLDIERFAALVAADEREACAKVCEETYTGEEASHDWPTPEMCAAAIRARGQA